MKKDTKVRAATISHINKKKYLRQGSNVNGTAHGTRATFELLQYEINEPEKGVAGQENNDKGLSTHTKSSACRNQLSFNEKLVSRNQTKTTLVYSPVIMPGMATMPMTFMLLRVIMMPVLTDRLHTTRARELEGVTKGERRFELYRQPTIAPL